jgi:hypothetical protein
VIAIPLEISLGFGSSWEAAAALKHAVYRLTLQSAAVEDNGRFILAHPEAFAAGKCRYVKKHSPPPSSNGLV